MKYDITKKMTKGAERTLQTFFKTLFELLASKPFEGITVQEICQNALYPRATFYNYFEDKFDLLTYCWQTIYQQIQFDKYKDLTSDECLHQLFDYTYDFIQTNHHFIKTILEVNTKESLMFHHFRLQMGNKMLEAFEHCQDRHQFPVPYEMVTEHYCNTILLVLDWSFFRGQLCSKQEAHDYLGFLLEAK